MIMNKMLKYLLILCCIGLLFSCSTVENTKENEYDSVTPYAKGGHHLDENEVRAEIKEEIKEENISKIQNVSNIDYKEINGEMNLVITYTASNDDTNKTQVEEDVVMLFLKSTDFWNEETKGVLISVIFDEEKIIYYFSTCENIKDYLENKIDSDTFLNNISISE